MRSVGILAFAKRSAGGVYQYSLSYAQSLARMGNNRYTLFTDADNEDYDALGIPVIKLPPLPALISAGAITLSLLSANRLLSFLVPTDPFNGMDLLLAPVVCNHLYITRKPFVVTLHDLQEKYFPEYFRMKQRIGREVRNHSLSRRASRILCESRYVRDDLVRFLAVEEQRISVIPAPATQLFAVDVAEQRLAAVKARYSLRDPYVLYPAQFWPHKNHVRLLEAFERLRRSTPDLQLVLTGGKQNHYDAVQAAIEKHGLRDSVRVLGYVDYEDLPVIYKLSRLLVMPSLYESISIPIYEAFSLGIPVCASGILGIPEQAGDAALFFDPRDPSDIAAKMRAILEDEELGQTLAAKGQARIARLTLESYGRALEQIVAEVLGVAGSPR